MNFGTVRRYAGKHHLRLRSTTAPDHGLGQGGNIPDLVMAMHRLENVSQALSKLSDTTPSSSPAKSISFQKQKNIFGHRY
jgi:hypothetical protein